MNATPTTITSAVRLRLAGTIFVMAGLFSAGQLVSFTLLSIVAARLAGSESVAGVPSTLALVGRVVAAYPIGWLMGKAGRRIGLVLGMAAGVVGSLVSVAGIVGGSFWLFALGAGLAGVARGSSDLGRFAASEVYSADQRARVIGLIVFAGTFGAIGGPLLVSPSTEWSVSHGLPADAGPFMLSALLCLLGAVLVFIFLRPDPLAVSRMMQEQEEGDAPAAAARLSLSELLARPQVRLGTLAMAIGQLVMTMLMVITPLHMSHLGQGTGDIALVIMSHTLGMYGLSSLTGWLIDRAGTVAVIVGGSIILVASAVLTPILTSVMGLAFALFLLGLGWNFCFVAGSSMLTTGLPADETARVQGSSDAFAAAAGGLGSLGSGLLFGWGAMTLPSGISIALVVALILVTFVDGRRRVVARA